MLKVSGLIAFAVATLAAANPAGALTLWQKVDVGMSAMQVKSFYPSSVGPVQVTEVLNQDSPSPTFVLSKTRTRLNLKGVQIWGEPFQAAFMFDQDKLNEVLLSLDNQGQFASEHGNFDVQFLLLKDDLTKRYGQPIKDDDDLIFKTHTVDYLSSNGISIELTLSKLSHLPYLDVTYKPAQREGGDAPL